MPGPASPKRKKKQNAAKQQDAEAKARAKAEREPIRDFTLPPNYTPKDDSVIHNVPLDVTLTEEGKEWWDEWGGKDGEFATRQGNKGDKQGAMAWVREKYILRWWAEFFPEAANAPEFDIAWFFDRSRMGQKIYAYLDNWHKRHPKGSAPPKTSKKAKKLKKKTFGHDFWRREDMEVYEEAIRLWKEEHERVPNFGEVRSVSSQEFKKLPLEEQKKWKAKAKDALKAIRAQAKLTDPVERAQYIDDFFLQLHELAEQAEEIAGVQMLTLVVHEREDGKFHIGWEVSDGLRAFGKTEIVGHTMTALQGHIQKSVGLGVVSPFPRPAVYMGWGADDCRKLYRDYVKETAIFQGFRGGRFIWTEMSENLDYYFDPKRLPCREFGDPSRLQMPILLLSLQFFVACQTGNVPDDMVFQILRVPAGSGPVINKADSQETDREEVTRGGKTIIVLVFKNRVTKCHQADGKMRYEQAGTNYADFLALGMTHEHALTAPPESWLQLPSAGPTIPKSVIFGTELERLHIWADLLSETAKNRIIRLIDATNEHQAHIPATHPKGVYLRRGPVPLIIPPSVLESRVSETTWGPSCYYQPHGLAPEAGTLWYFEVYQKELRETDIIRHQPSKSYFGGETGLVRVVRALIQLYFNCCAACGDFEPPEDPLADFDLSRFPTSEHDRIVLWINAWTLSITEDTKILRQSSQEHEKGLAQISEVDGHKLAENHPPIPVDSGPNSTMNTANTSLAAPTQHAPRKRKRALSLSDEDTDGEHSGGKDIYFEDLDKTEQDHSRSDDDMLRLHNRDLPDSTYPKGDDLGLYARYRFNPMVPHVVIDGFGDEEPKLWTNVTSVFGDLPRLPQYIAPCLTHPESFMRMLQALESEATKVKEAWTSFCTDNPRMDSEVQWSVNEWIDECEEDLQLLHHVKYLRQLLWMRAAAMAPTVFAHWRSMMYVLRQGMTLFATLDKMLKREAFPDPKTTALVLDEYALKAKRPLVLVESFCYELLQWQKLATKHYNLSKGAWSPDREPESVGELATIGQSIVDWISEVAQTRRQLKNRRKERWMHMLGEEYQSQAGMVYLFGCPSKGEKVDGLLECITEHVDDDSGWSDPPKQTGEPAPPSTVHSRTTSPVIPAASTPPDNSIDESAKPPRKRPVPKRIPAPDADSASVLEPAPTGVSSPANGSTAIDHPPPDPPTPATEQQQVLEILISAEGITGGDAGDGANPNVDASVSVGNETDKDSGQCDGQDSRTGDRSSEALSLLSLRVISTPAPGSSKVSTNPPTPSSTPPEGKKRKRKADDAPAGTRKSARVDALKALAEQPQLQKTRGATTRAAASKVVSQPTGSRRR